MKSYSSLRIIAGIFNVLGYISLASGLFVAYVGSFTVNADQGWQPMQIAIGIGVLLATLVISLICWGISQFIKLAVNTADSIKNMEHNVYLITERTRIEA